LYDWRTRDIITPSIEVRNEQGQVEDVGFSYADLTIIKIMKAYREEQFDLKSIVMALQHLFERLGPPRTGWADAKVYVFGNKIFAHKPDAWDVTAATQGGTRVETRVFGDLFSELRELEEEGEILVPSAFRPYVEIDPAIMGGEPVVRDTRLPTSILLDLKEKGRTLAQIARLYEPISRKFIEKAIEFEEYLSQPSSARTPVA